MGYGQRKRVAISSKKRKCSDRSRHQTCSPMKSAVDALKGRFQREDVPGLKKYVLLERRRVAIELGWCSRDEAATIQSIWCPLPYPREQESDEDQEMFITQSTALSQLRSQVPSQTSTQKKRTKKKDQLGRVPKRGRITNFFSPSQHPLISKEVFKLFHLN